MNLKESKAKFKVMLLALMIGVITGIISLLFNQVLNAGFRLVESIFETRIFIFILPIVAASIVGFIRHKILDAHNQGFGVSQVMYEIEHINTHVMKPLGVLYKIIGTFLTLLAGFSAGRQGPIVHLGGAIGSQVAYRSGLDSDEKRVLIGCGVAGCLAGVFNSPIFAVLFVVEILFKKRYFDMISTVVLSALASTIIVRLVRSEAYFDGFKVSYVFDMSEVISFIIIGLILGCLAAVYVLGLQQAKKILKKIELPQYIKNLSGALLIGTMLYFFSDFYIYNPKPALINIASYTTLQLYVISVLLIILTSITIASGGFGGIFTPGLMIGLTFGLALSHTMAFLGFPILDSNTYALAGMAAMYSGFAIAPLSAALMIVELTGQYTLIFPILICTLVSSKVTEMTIHESIYHQDLKHLLLADQVNDHQKN